MRKRQVSIAVIAAFATCASHRARMPIKKPTHKVVKVADGDLCVTHGAIDVVKHHLAIKDASTRAVAAGSSGDAAKLWFTYQGPTDETSKLASGDVRRQLGLKLRAADGCNLVYVIWRIEPKAELVVQTKHNPGKRTHDECGAEGYTRVKAEASVKAPAIKVGSKHELQVEAEDDTLYVWADSKLVWWGKLGDAGELTGLAGIRTDNVEVKADLWVEASDHAADAPATCGDGGGDEE
jgi:hypothetical protein